MATYNQLAMSGGGALGEALTVAGAPYTFTFSTPTFPSQSIYGGDAYFILNSSVGGNPLLSPINAAGPLRLGSIPMSNTVGSIDGPGVNKTFTFDVQGDNGGGGAVINLTSGDLDPTLTPPSTTIISAMVVKAGLNFRTGDGITITQNDLQAAGFTNADDSQQFDVFTNYIETGYAINADLGGVYNTPTGDVRMEQFASSSDGNNSIFNVGFNLRQDVGSGNGSFNFTPNVDIAANSYTIQSTGHYTLTIA
tara:strand:- start:21 stop:773 length:753 start_codon:yes stop_codon:yes gene_type:complete